MSQGARSCAVGANPSWHLQGEVHAGHGTELTPTSVLTTKPMLGEVERAHRMRFTPEPLGAPAPKSETYNDHTVELDL